MKDKKTPILDPKHKNEQNIEKQDSPQEPNSNPESVKKPKKENPKKVPESNDPVGYGESDDVKESPYKKK
ncbi:MULTISPECIES: hypothetical protein [Aequorivita]|uniref:Uncharacterized protein n=1 Tax=Aequorivita iocasae TaxID=2803865 RepID=A0ABX7DTP3_9FLAO|nr:MULTISPECIES: hypothetical protein [Aequorivita]QQX76144.1 hypothetical protein JK629_12500 [Aequorivita iocasae]UCA55603.1 hypothetical protein LDL78_12555 [Aequorivita sp. F7]